MVTLFDEEKIREIHDYNVAKDAWREGYVEGFKLGLEKTLKPKLEQILKIKMEQSLDLGLDLGMDLGMEKGLKEGIEQGREQGIRSMVSMLEELSFSKEAITQNLASKFDLPLHVAEEKVKQYSTQ